MLNGAAEGEEEAALALPPPEPAPKLNDAAAEGEEAALALPSLEPTPKLNGTAADGGEEVALALPPPEPAPKLNGTEGNEPPAPNSAADEGWLSPPDPPLEEVTALAPAAEPDPKWDIVGRELLLADPKLNDPEDTAPLEGAAPAAAALAPKRNDGEASPAPTPVGVASKLAPPLEPLAGSAEEAADAIPAFCSGSCRGSTGLCPCCSSHCSPLLFNGQVAPKYERCGNERMMMPDDALFYNSGRSHTQTPHSPVASRHHDFVIPWISAERRH